MSKDASNRKVIRAKAAFYISILVIIAACCAAFLIGPTNIFNDLLTITSILSFMLFLFLSFGLYNGFTIHDDLPDLTRKIKFTHFFDVSSYTSPNIDIDLGEGFLGIIFGIIMWIVVSVIISFLLAFLFMSVWALLLIIVIAFYWIFYRAIRLVFIKSDECKGSVTESLKYGLLYTVLYSVWFYGIIYLSKIIKSN